jgi:hypothetical protein
MRFLLVAASGSDSSVSNTRKIRKCSWPDSKYYPCKCLRNRGKPRNTSARIAGHQHVISRTLTIPSPSRYQLHIYLDNTCGQRKSLGLRKLTLHIQSSNYCSFCSIVLVSCCRIVFRFASALVTTHYSLSNFSNVPITWCCTEALLSILSILRLL